jgi:hypothetical protein
VRFRAPLHASISLALARDITYNSGGVLLVDVDEGLQARCLV